MRLRTTTLHPVIGVFISNVLYISGSLESDGSTINNDVNTTTTTETVSCPEEFKHFNDKCYKYFDYTERQSWSDANDTCHTLGGTLAEPRSSAENIFLFELRKKNDGRSYTWLGGNRLTTGRWEWNSGGAIDDGFTTWWAGESRFGDWGPCLAMHPPVRNGPLKYNGRWLGYWACNSPRPFWCQTTASPRTILTPTKTTSLQPKTTEPPTTTNCPEKFTKFDDKCYILLGLTWDTRKSWYDANDTCHTLGGILAEPRTSAVNNFIFELMQNNSGIPNFWTWLGGNRLDTGRWMWNSGDAIEYGVTFTSWWFGREREQRYDGWDCLSMHPPNRHGPDYEARWLEYACSSEQPFACQKDLA